MERKRVCRAMMSLVLLPLLWGTQTQLLAGEERTSPPACRVLPRPVKVDYAEGSYKLAGTTVIHVGSAELMDIGRYLAELVAPATGLRLTMDSAVPVPGVGIALKLDDTRKDMGEEGYALVCTTQGVTITAARPAGVFYGVQTLRQLLPAEIESRKTVDKVAWTVPCLSIEDRPRFRWRGYMYDPAREFRTLPELKRYVDLLALQKLNLFHLHLTDDQGWRLEIKKYPKLVEVGARLPNWVGKTGEGWFYTQAQMKELVAYAASRHVTVMPEIDIPGHSMAATQAYPELGCGGKPSNELCLSKEGTVEFMRNVLGEVLELFPSPFIHVGADEAMPTRWRACPSCKPAMDRLAGRILPGDVNVFRVKVTSGAGRPFYEDIARLQGDFIRKIDLFLTERGRRMVGWDEILDGGLKTSSPAVVMVWRSPLATAGAAGQGRDALVCQHPDYYLDNQISLERTYAYEPAAGVSADDEKHVVGVLGAMWGCYTPTIRVVDEQSFPRLCAIAETGWTPRAQRNFADFHGRLRVFINRLDVLGVNYRRPSVWTFVTE